MSLSSCISITSLSAILNLQRMSRSLLSGSKWLPKAQLYSTASSRSFSYLRNTSIALARNLDTVGLTSGTHYVRSRSFSKAPQPLVQEALKTEQSSIVGELPDPKHAKYCFREFELADRVFVVTGNISLRSLMIHVDSGQVVDKV